MAAHARGAVCFVEGDAQATVEPLRLAFAVWHRIRAPHICARIRVHIAQAYRALGDHDGARLELEGARSVFQQLGANPDLMALDASEHFDQTSGHGLSRREREVLRLVASGKTNKVIARELGVSERTIDRHVSNIFTKLEVDSRAGATAFAYEHHLV